MHGLKARGGLEVEIHWQNGQLTRAVLHSSLGGPCTVRLGEQVKTLATEAGKSYTLDETLA